MKVNGWKTCKVDDIFLLKGGSAFKEKYQGQLCGEYPFIKVSDFNLPNNKMFITSANNWISKEVKNTLKPNIFPNNTIVFAKVGAALSSNRRRILTRNTAIDNNMMGAIPKNIDPLFGYYVFCTIDFNKFVQDGAVPSVNQKQIGNVLVYIPESTSEQQKIAEVLLTVDKRINLIDQKIAETEKLKTGLMQKLFSEGVGVQDENGNWQPHTEFQDSPFGKIPRAWKYAPVKSLVSIKSPKYDPKIKTESLPCIELEHLSQGSGEILGTVNSLELASTKNCFAKGDVLFGKLRPYLKKFAKPNFNGVCSSEIWVMKTTDNKVLHNDFWFYFIQSDRFINEANKSCGTKMPRADWKVVSELILPIPSFCEQLGIAKILECVDAKLGLLKQQKAETQQLKKGLMQKLLTGEWRVPVEETEAA
ncbi:restriction endonuclease subunit S [Vibrio alginolyticus]|uniref:restriction endonuclease subunit S n=1 Tax=Vibrio harveyi group TaxID=717610 RepID=UPI00106EDAFA|nr:MULTISPECIES: restriction endonuclease subunit S [Vibrio harveyi group]EKO3743614.1 restriction endonuclease subunit S [Vibrio metschnikovii]MCS0123354.1 restriction endonuclease subunit S [Vibrio alginolyticus]MDN8586168.1 restriction endonuclease subunit S [Vibrio alginolyticus]